MTSRYVTKKGKFICWAWSVMNCRSEDRHKPHLYNSVNFSYGPYCCPGNPPKKVIVKP